MKSVEQIQRGFARYIDSEFTAKITGWRKWAFGAGAALMIDNAATITEELRNNPIVKSMGILDDGGGVDVEKIYCYLKA